MKRKLKIKNINEKDKWFLNITHQININSAIFNNQKLTIFESIVKYLKEEKAFSFHEISLILNRDERNIWTVYKNALKKV